MYILHGRTTQHLLTWIFYIFFSTFFSPPAFGGTARPALACNYIYIYVCMYIYIYISFVNIFTFIFHFTFGFHQYLAVLGGLHWRAAEHLRAPWMTSPCQIPALLLRYYYLCVLILLCMCPHTAMYVSSYYCICALILLYMRPHTSMHVCSYDCMCVLILLYMCPHTTRYASSYYYIVYMRPHTPVYVCSY
jgi:hypothetical protein